MVTIFFYRRIVSKLKALKIASDVSTIHPTSRRNNGLVRETRLSTPFNKILATPLKGVKQSKGQEESQEEKKLEARNGEYNTPIGYSKVLEDPQED